jgi:UDP:flavonoid glycosyltransferase YjiC (YdhE family)
LGLGLIIKPQDFSASALIAALDTVLTNSQFRTRPLELNAQTNQPAEELKVCDFLERWREEMVARPPFNRAGDVKDDQKQWRLSSDF